jgi:hypothetical protein
MRNANSWPLVMAFAVMALPAAAQPEGSAGSRGGRYTIVIEGYDWGAGVSKVVLSMEETVSSARARDYSVAVRRHTDCVELPPEQAAGERLVVHAYVSDSRGEKRDEGDHVTLVLGVAPEWSLGSPLHYVHNEKCRGNV